MKENLKNKNRILVSLLAFSLIYSPVIFADEIPLKRLDDFAKQMRAGRAVFMGYPVNQDTDLREFYQWYLDSKLYEVAMNNVGDPQKEGLYSLNTHQFENEVVDFFVPLYGFSKEEAWGFVTSSGTDGNEHGMYFGVRTLLTETGMKPVCYVSEDAHYSIKKLADVQNLELRLIKTDETGKMIVSEFEKALDPAKPALVVIAMGTTFKGAIDHQAAIHEVLLRKKPVAVFVHVDAALFGGYLPFTEHKDLVDRRVVPFDSIAVSGHKFFGLDEPMGIFLTTKATKSKINPFKVSYLSEAVPTITCSRNAVSALKFWWKIKKKGTAAYEADAKGMLANAQYLKAQLSKISWPVWLNDYSNTVYFRRPSDPVMKKYGLAPDSDPRLGGDLAHIVVMPSVTRDVIDQFVSDLKQ